ncbi:hypothetical protein EUGRSUZ_J00805 [Eucalyptus grandis]|uniref:histidine kinase n=2 Tax=Eucalyptus grandis TaxID=71139 RepID=A0A059ACV6_EUCGR|nr:hypothetical protein EUGRSUZ_J00805 [Eucalyptus grandis]
MILSILSTLVYKTVYDYQITKIEAALGSMCDKRVRMLQNQFTVNVNHIHALAVLVARFYYQQNATDTKQMREALAGYMDSTTFERPLFSGVAYAERVVHSERENFERQHGWKIRDMNLERQPSPVREEYAPVIFCQENIAHVNSLDILSGKEDQDYALKARAVGKAVMSGPFRLIRAERIGVFLTYPVHRSTLSPSIGVEEQTRATAGYIGVIFHFESLVENVLWQLGNQMVLVTVYDITNSSRSLMYGHEVKSDWPMMHESKLELGDPFRRHLMICRYRDATSLSWIPAIIAVSVVAIGLLAPCVLYAAAIHKVNIRQASLRIQGLEVQLQDANTANSQVMFLGTYCKSSACCPLPGEGSFYANHV